MCDPVGECCFDDKWLLWAIFGPALLLLEASCCACQCYEARQRLSVERHRYFVATAAAFYDVLDLSRGYSQWEGGEVYAEPLPLGVLSRWETHSRVLQPTVTDLAAMLAAAAPSEERGRYYHARWDGFKAEVRSTPCGGKVAALVRITHTPEQHNTYHVGTT